MTRLPNLELLMYKAIEHLKQDEEFCKKCEGLPNYGHKRVNFTIETFPQIWGVTCTGFDVTEDGRNAFGGDAMTTEYTTVVHEERTDFYVVLFEERACYVVHNPTKEFYEDLKERRLASLSKAKERYQMEREEELKELKYRELKKIIVLKEGSGEGFRELCKCPSCDERLNEFDRPDYCPYCGQKLDWSALYD